MTTATVERVSLSVNEAAASLGVGRDLIFRELNSGALKSFKIGGRRLILVSDLRDFAQRQAADPTPGATKRKYRPVATRAEAATRAMRYGRCKSYYVTTNVAIENRLDNGSKRLPSWRCLWRR